jgi:aspartyl protease family protein
MRQLLAITLLIGAIAAAMPSLFTRYLDRSPQAEAVATESVEEADDGARSASAPRHVEIRAGRDGHFYVEASINFRPVRVLVDTGATVVALRASDAAAAGIRFRAADFVNPVQTANGTTQAAEAVLDSVSVSDIEIRHVRALVIPDEQLSISLLGGSFLRALQRYEVADGTLVFEN